MTRRADDEGAAAPIVVGVGASAGGLEALSAFFDALPGDSGLAFAVVQHLAPDTESALPSLLQAHSAMPVLEATTDVEVVPDHVYVIVPGTTLTLEGGTLHVEPRSRRLHLPIDALFHSLAAARPGRAVGVLLSGTGSDGVDGLGAIRATGGLAFAQDEATATFPELPRSAAQARVVDRVLPPHEIARALEDLPAVGPIGGPVADDRDLAIVLERLRQSSGVDFASYRPTTLRRRIERRMTVTRSATLAEYADLLAEDPRELRELARDALIHVTRFFRDPELFTALREAVFPELVRDRAPDRPLRVWVPACSTGQEAYSLAMSLLEYLDEQGLPFGLQLFATDVSDDVALRAAREGRYPASVEQEVGRERLERFFVREDAGWHVSKRLRSTIVFARQDVGADPPFSHMDLISCRNLLIYLAPALQQRVLASFHFALDPGRFLVLGASETVGAATELFRPVDARNRIYVRRTMSEPARARLPAAAARARGPAPSDAGPADADWPAEVDRILAARWGPPAIVVGSDDRVLRHSGDTSPFVSAPHDGPLRATIREGLGEVVDEVIREARGARAPATRSVEGGVGGPVDVIAFPLAGSADQRVAPPVLVVFDRRPEAGPAARLAPWGWLRRLPFVGDATAEAEVAQLRRELASTRQYLGTVIARQDAAHTVLASANDEAVAANEELQSTNEELETAKEELQSLNEELTTVNEQLEQRNADLTRLSDDLVNLLESAAVPMVALDRELRIRRFTPSAGRALHLVAHDVGRPLAHFRGPIDMDDLTEVCGAVLASGEVTQREFRDDEGRWHALRVHPYRTTEIGIDGVVLVLADIDATKRVEEALTAARDHARSIVETVREPLLVVDSELRAVSANAAFYRYYGVDPAQVEGRPLGEVTGPWQDEELARELGRVLRGEATVEDREFRQESATGEVRLGRLAARRIEGLGATRQLLVAVMDETVRHRLAVELQRYADELVEADARKNEFLATLAHELRNPLTPMRNALSIRKLAGPQSEAAVEADGMLERQVRHLTRLVDDLLDVSRISLGRIELRRERLDLARAVAEAVDAARSDAEEAGHRITVRLPDEPVWIDADPVRVDQIVGNLLTNAIKYTPADGHIDVSLAEDGPDAVLAIADDGIGIARAQLPRLWELFAQGEQDRYRARGGLGIGLALVRTLVELHGGTATADSEGPGRGSRFVVRLPLPTGPVAAAPAEPEGPSTELPRRRVLVVDDDPDVAHSLGKLLELMDQEVRVVTDATTAIATAVAFVPDLVLLDIGLGAVSGLVVAGQLRAEPSLARATLVALTGYGTDEDRARFLAAGFDLHLVKPLEPDELEELLRRPVPTS